MAVTNPQTRNISSHSLITDAGWSWSYSGTHTVVDTSGFRYVYMTGSGTFTVTGGPARPVQILIVGGGGAGGCIGTNPGQGGGGGGGGILAPNIALSAGSYSVTIGAGAAGNSENPNVGGPSQFGPYWVPGGGSGGVYNARQRPWAEGYNSSVVFNSLATAQAGGSGGGAGQTISGTVFGGPTISSAVIGFTIIGNNGGAWNNGSGQGGSNYAGAGGGGGSQVGGEKKGTNGANAGAGGNGAAWLDGNIYSGGGGGSAHENASFANSLPAIGGTGGGGSGAYGANPFVRVDSTAGTVNTGGGGGGGGGGNVTYTSPGAAGGSGIVVIRWAI